MQFLNLEAAVDHGDGSEEDEDEEGLEGETHNHSECITLTDRQDFIDTRDISENYTVPLPPRITSLGDSAEDLEREAQAIKDRYIASREQGSSDDESNESHIYQVFVKVC